MSDTVVSTPEPQKSKGKFIILLLLILGALGVDYKYSHVFLNKEVVVSDSSNVITVTPDVPADSIKAVTTVSDSIKK